MRKVRWGVLGVSRMATAKVIPGMQAGAWSEIAAIASRDRGRAEEAARRFGIARAYGSYEELLADGEIEAVYNPLPNHLHVPWSIRAAERGKHVLCEKPIGLSVAEARELIAARDRTYSVRTSGESEPFAAKLRERGARVEASGPSLTVTMPEDFATHELVALARDSNVIVLELLPLSGALA